MVFVFHRSNIGSKKGEVTSAENERDQEIDAAEKADAKAEEVR